MKLLTLNRILGVGVCLMLVLTGVAPAWAAPIALLPLLGETVDTTILNSAMKIIFEDSIVYNVVSDTEWLSMIETDTDIKEEESTGGRYIETAQYFGLPSGVGFRHENDYIPVPGGPDIQNSRVYLKKAQGVVEMTGDTMKRVRTNEGAFLNWADRALPDLVTRLRSELDRVALGYGSGIKCLVNDAAPDATLGVDSAFGLAGLTNEHLLFLEGEKIVFSANATGNPLRVAGPGQSAVVEQADATLLTLDALPAGVAQNDYIFSGDDAGQSGQGASGIDREMMGLLGMVDDGTVLATFQNIVRANYKLWRSIIVDGSPAPHNGLLNEDLLTEADDETAISGDGEMDLFVTNRVANRKYWASLKSDRTINDPRTYTGGTAGNSIILGDRTIPIKVARKLPPELAFGIQTSTFKKWMLGVFEWDDITGSIWNRVTDATGRKDAFYAVGNMYIQLGCLAPRKNFKIEGLVSV